MEPNEWTMRVLSESPTRGVDRFTLVVLSFYADREGRCWPGFSELANAIGIGMKQAYEAMQRLETAGEIERVEQGRSHRATVYRLTPGRHSAEPATPPNPVTPRPLAAVTEPDDQPLDDGPQPAARPAWEPTWPRIITRAMYLDPEHPWRADCPPNLLDWLDREGPPDHDDWVWALMSPRAIPLLNHQSQPYLGSKTGPR